VTALEDAARRPGRRVALSRDRILRAALVSIDEHGVESLTMQRLAASLGTGAMSLYNHVKNKDDLLAGVSELVWEEVAAAAPPSDDHAAWLLALGSAIRAVARRHRRALGVFVAGGVFPPALLEVIAEQFEREGGDEPDPRLVAAITTVSAFALGWAVTEASGLAPSGAVETERQRIRRVTRALPPDTPDRLVDAAIAVCASEIEPMFATGLSAIVTGCGYTTPTPVAEATGSPQRRSRRQAPR
jgi:AcrR family transcriptional regulator